MWKFLANPLQEMVKTNLIQHKILNTSYYIDFFAVNIKVIILFSVALNSAKKFQTAVFKSFLCTIQVFLFG